MDLLGILGPSQLEGITVFEPVVRHFLLVAVHDLLLEHAVVVADAAAVGGIVQGGEGIQETGCKTAQTAVTQRGVRLLILNGIHLEAELLERFRDRLVGHKVDSVIAESTAHQELHREIEKGLGILIVESLLCAHPAVDDLILQRQGGCLEHLLIGGFLHGAAVHRAHVVLYTSLEKVFVKFNSGSF